jgi:hypothetical protein
MIKDYNLQFINGLRLEDVLLQIQNQDSCNTYYIVCGNIKRYCGENLYIVDVISTIELCGMTMFVLVDKRCIEYIVFGEENAQKLYPMVKEFYIKSDSTPKYSIVSIDFDRLYTQKTITV